MSTRSSPRRAPVHQPEPFRRIPSSVWHTRDGIWRSFSDGDTSSPHGPTLQHSLQPPLRLFTPQLSPVQPQFLSRSLARFREQPSFSYSDSHPGRHGQPITALELLSAPQLFHFQSLYHPLCGSFTSAESHAYFHTAP